MQFAARFTRFSVAATNSERGLKPQPPERARGAVTTGASASQVRSEPFDVVQVSSELFAGSPMRTLVVGTAVQLQNTATCSGGIYRDILKKYR
jgi:hypothetical protein